MAGTEGVKLAELLERKSAEVRQATAGLDEHGASRHPPGEDRWSVKQAVSHLRGPETGYVPGLSRFLTEDTPLLDLEPGNPFYTESRERESLDQLLAGFEEEFGRVADFVRPLSDEQLGRRAQIPMLRESPLGEYPTLGQWIAAIAEFHLDFHVEQIRTIRRDLGA